LLWHLELVKQQGSVRVAALPLVRWRGAALLEQLMDDCRAHGAVVFNPHVITVEDGGLVLWTVIKFQPNNALIRMA